MITPHLMTKSTSSNSLISFNGLLSIAIISAVLPVSIVPNYVDLPIRSAAFTVADVYERLQFLIISTPTLIDFSLIAGDIKFF